MLIQFSIFPTGTGESVSGEVAKVIDIIDRSGLSYKVSSMSTVIEGDWDEIMPVINKCRMKLKETNNRVYLVLTMDDRKDMKNRMIGKVESLKNKLKRDINT
jgi:uncharacterized protein (TIGR00106 family)